MNSEMLPFDYAAVPGEQAELCRMVEFRIKARTGMAIVENGRDLLMIKEALGHGRFSEWLRSWFPLSERTAREWMNVANEYGSKTELGAVLGSKVLCLLAAPSTPPEARVDIEARALAGEPVTVADVKAEIARVKAEANAEIAAARAKLATAEARADAAEAEKNESKAAASRREANLLARAKAAEGQVSSIRAETSRDVQQRLEDQIAAAKAEAAEARRLAEEKTRTLNAAVAKAKAEAEQAAQANADAMAQAALAKSREELKVLEAKARTAKAQMESALGAKKDFEEQIERHREVLARMESAETEGLEQLKLMSDIGDFIGQSMIRLAMFETTIHPLAVHKADIAARMCEQFALAVRTFAAPRLPEHAPVSTS